MPLFEIVEIKDIRCHLVARVHHFNPDGSIWFRED